MSFAFPAAAQLTRAEAAIQLDAAARAVVEGRIEAAEVALAGVLASKPARMLWPHALVHRATCERLRGTPFRAQATLNEADALLPSGEPTSEFVAQARRIWISESIRTAIDLALLDRIGDLLDRRRRLPGADAPFERFSAALLEMELHSARSDPARLLRTIERARSDAELLASSPAAGPHFDVLEVVARHDLGVPPAERQGLAARMVELLADPAMPESLRYSLGRVTVPALHAAGEPERALRIAEALLGGPVGENLRRRALILASVAAIDLESGDPARLAATREDLAATTAAWYASIAATPPRDGGVGWFAYDDRRRAVDALLRLDAAVLDAEPAALAAAEHLEATFALGTLSRQLGARSPSVAEFRSQLPADGGALLLSIDARVAHLVAIDAAGAEHVAVTLDAEAVDDRRALLDAVLRPADRSATATAELWRRAERLGGELFTPGLRERLTRWRSVTLVGDARSAGLVQLLPCDSTWLCLARPVRHVPSLALGELLAERAAQPAPATGELAVLAAPPLPPELGLDPLDDVVPRLGATLQRLLPRRATTRVGAAAGRNALDDPALTGASVFCVVTHGCHDFERERSAGFRLAAGAGTDGAVYADALDGARFGPLVIAAVCGATSGPPRLGDDGSEHLGGAFLQSGAVAVIAAAGDLPVDATLDLLDALLHRLDRGETAAEALRAARLAVARRPATAHPWFFAGLLLTGHDIAPWSAR